jgi:hypothetical protein
MNRGINFLIVAFCLLSSPTAHPAQDAQQPLDSSDYSYGEVVKATDKDLSVLEYDYEMDEERTVNYSVNPETALTNIGKAAQLAKGDTVEVYFKDVGGAKMAQMIIKDDTANPAEDQTPAP